jgi:hypothetical protein
MLFYIKKIDKLNYYYKIYININIILNNNEFQD